MTNEELIEKLKEFPMDYEVWFSSRTFSREVETVTINKDSLGKFIFLDGGQL